MRNQNSVFVIGTGNVGQELIAQIKAHPCGMSIIGTCNSKHLTIRGKNDTLQNLNEIPALLKSHGFGDEIIFVDVSSGKETLRDFHIEVITKTKYRMVTANKNPLSLYDFATYETLTNDSKRYAYSATVMAGLGAVPWIRQRTQLGDSIRSISASLSGTLGFLCDQLNQGKKLSACLAEAKEKGYTEPDFRDDLSGVDVARKLTILARDSGQRIDFSDVKISKFLPEQYFALPSVEACLEKIEKDYDSVMQQKFEDARKHGKTFKFLGSITIADQKASISVGLQEFSLDSAFGRLKGTNNRLEVTTDLYTSEKPFTLEGPGAGAGVTASVIRRDLLQLQ